MSPIRTALLGGPLFVFLWFVGAQIVWFAVGGETPADRSGFAEVLLANQSSAYAGGTLLVLAAASLLWFAAGLRERTRPSGIGVLTTVATASIAVLLVLQGGLVIEAATIAEDAPDLSWVVYQLSSAVGYESFMASLLGAVALGAALVAFRGDSMRRWLWWVTAVFAAALAVGGTLEGLGVVPNGRFAIFFVLWALIAGLALFAIPETEESARP